MSVQRYFFNFVARLLVPPGEIHVSPGGTPAGRQKNLYDRAALNPITLTFHCHFPKGTQEKRDRRHRPQVFRRQGVAFRLRWLPAR